MVVHHRKRGYTGVGTHRTQGGYTGVVLHMKGRYTGEGIPMCYLWSVDFHIRTISGPDAKSVSDKFRIHKYCFMVENFP